MNDNDKNNELMNFTNKEINELFSDIVEFPVENDYIAVICNVVCGSSRTGSK